MSLFQAIKTVFYGERDEPADRVQRSLLERIAAIPRLTGILPYLGWMDEEDLFVLDQGAFGDRPGLTMGFCIETQPQTGSNEEMERVLASLFMSCPAGTGIQISLYASPNILPTLREQANMLPVDTVRDPQGLESSRNRNIYRVLGRRRIDHYLRGTSRSLFGHQVYLLRDYRCVIALSLPLDPESPADVEEAIRIRESTHATLRSAHMAGWDWRPEHLLNFVADFFDHERILGAAEERHLEHDPARSLRSQLADAEIASALADTFIKCRKAGGEETALQCFSVRQYPKYYRLGSMGSLIGDYYQLALAIPCPFLITMGAILLDYESARGKALVKAARATQAAGSYMAHFQPDLQDRKRDWDMVLRAFDNGRNVVQMYHQIVLLSKVEDVSRTEHAVRAVWRARGFDLAKDVYLQHQASWQPCPAR